MVDVWIARQHVAPPTGSIVVAAKLHTLRGGKSRENNSRLNREFCDRELFIGAYLLMTPDD